MGEAIQFPNNNARQEGFGGYDDLPNRLVDLAEAFPMSKLTDAQLDAYRHEHVHTLHQMDDASLYARLRELLGRIDQLLDEQVPAEGLSAPVEVTYIIHTLLGRALDAQINFHA